MNLQFRLPEGANHRLMGALRGRNIFRQGNPAEAIYRVEHGCVRLQLEHADGQRQVIAFIFPGQTFCVGFETHWASADAVTDTVLSRFSRNTLWELISQDPSAAEALLFSADERLTELAYHVSRLTHSTAYDRMVWFVDWVANQPGAANGAKGGGIVDLPMSRQDIADFLGIAPETVSRLLRRLTGEGVLRRIGSRRYRYDPHGLADDQDRRARPASDALAVA